MLSGFVLDSPFDLDWDDRATERIERFGQVTMAIDRETPIERVSIALLVERQELIAIGRLTKGTPITTFERRVSLSDIHHLPTPLSIEDLVAGLEPRLRRHAEASLYGDGKVPAATWNATRQFLREHHPRAWSAIRDIEAQVDPPQWAGNRTERRVQTVAQERDATALALALTDLSRSPVAGWTPDLAPAPFLSGLPEFSAYEDRLLEADLNVFGDWTPLRRSVIGAVEFEDRGKRVTVLNVNRTSIEETLGVDLVYYHHGFRAYVLVQYKRMTRRPTPRGPAASELVFQPGRDSNFAAQVAKMIELEGRTSGEPTDPRSYRLGPSTTYIKLCQPEMPLFGDGLSKGMYLPTRYWLLLAESPDFQGPRGGVTVTYKTVGRHLSNTQFVSLFQSGFIGSADVQSDEIGAVIAHSLEADHSVMLAVASS